MFGFMTKFRGPTDRRGKRIVATSDGVMISVPYDDALESRENHIKGAEALMDKMGRERTKGIRLMSTGYLGNGEYVHVLSAQCGARLEQMRADAEEAVAEFEKGFYGFTVRGEEESTMDLMGGE